MWVGAAVLGAGAIIAAVLPFSTRTSAAANAEVQAHTDQAELRELELAHVA
jgi:hypothetical protein